MIHPYSQHPNVLVLEWEGEESDGSVDRVTEEGQLASHLLSIICVSLIIFVVIFIMAACYVSDEAMEIAQLHEGVRGFCHKRRDNMNQPTREAVFEMLLGVIREIETVMILPTVRGHLDPNLQNPAVDNNSPWNAILRRLANQIKVVCVLADSEHQEPAENNDERVALNRVKEILRTNFKKIWTKVIFPNGQPEDVKFTDTLADLESPLSKLTLTS